MAPISEPSYFPPLDKCLGGEELLVSWKLVFAAINNYETLEISYEKAVERFLTNAEVLELLSKPFEAFGKSSHATKSTFETKTSAINVTPSSSAPYDVKEIKEDALWLSGSAKLDEVTALRMVVEEYQNRAAIQLLGPFSEQELVGIREVTGNNRFSSPIPGSLLSHGLEPEAIEKDFGSQSNRRQRILRNYLSERQYFLKCVERLLYAHFKNDSQTGSGKGKGAVGEMSWLDRCGSRVVEKMEPLNVENSLLQCTKAIEANILNLHAGSGCFDGERPEVEIDWIRSQITEATHSMEIIWQFLRYKVEFPSSAIVLEWFRLQRSCGFLDSFELEEPSVQVLLQALQSISIVISVVILRLVDSLDWLNDTENLDMAPHSAAAGKPFLLNNNALLEVHEILWNAAEVGFVTAGPALFTWSILLDTINRRIEFTRMRALEGDYSRFDRQSSVEADATLAPVPFEDFMAQIRSLTEEDPIDLLARTAVNASGVFQNIAALSSRLGSTANALFSTSTGAQMRIALLDLIKCSTERISYIPETIEAALAALTGGECYWDTLDSQILDDTDDPTLNFLQDEALVHFFLQNAQSRYPYETLPFLRIIRALAASPYAYSEENTPSLLTFLGSLPRFTYALPPDFGAYETAQEEDNLNNIRLTQPVHLFAPRSQAVRNQMAQNRSLTLVRADEDLCIPVGTFGRIISESGPRIAFWFHEYSGLKYFGKLLETFLPSSDQVDATTQSPADRESVSEIIELFATLLLGISRSDNQETNDADLVLEMASSGLNRNHDITTIVFDIFEAELQNQSTLSGPDVPLEILISCIHFIHALVSISPGRVWPFLSRSGLLGVSRGSGKLPRIVESVELLTGRYDLLISCCRLFDSLLDDYVYKSIRRKNLGKLSDRFQDEKDIGTGIPDQLISKIFLAYTTYMVDVLESSCTWRFVLNDDQRHLTTSISSTLLKILHCVYGIESSTSFDGQGGSVKTKSFTKLIMQATQKPVKLMDALLPSASFIIKNFLSTSPGTLRYQPLLRTFFSGLNTPSLTLSLNQSRLWKAEVESILSFSHTLLRVSTILALPTSQLEAHLFKIAPLIARLCAANDSYNDPIMDLLEALVEAASSNESEPPSLLGNLGPQTAKNFIHMLSNLDKPFSREGRVSRIWRFLSVVVSGRQQWFASYLLTGKTPREALQKASKDEVASFDRSILVTALATLSRIKDIPQVKALAILEFIALAQNFWPWAVCGSPKYHGFITSISEYVGTLTPLQSITDISACYQTRIAAYIAEILSMHLFHSRQMGNSLELKDLIPNLSYFERFAVAAPSYNSSLHTQLKRNFESRYAGSNLMDLKKTTLKHQQYGEDYFYDLGLGNKMLQYDPAWRGRKGDGFESEVRKANVNLSLVDAQMALFNSWKFLSTELSGSLRSEELQKILGKTAIACLRINSRSQHSEEIFSRLSQTRADFAIVLVQRLIQADSSTSEVKDLLNVTWEAIRSVRGQFEQTVPENQNIYYRSLLRLLFLSLRIHTEAKLPSAEDLRVSFRTKQSTTIIPIILEILRHVVATGLRDLASSIHDSPADSSPEDLALLTGIMQSCLRIPGIELSQEQIVNIMISSSIPRIALTLFSWSDKLAIQGDPIYGELSILFLLELSSIPLMAEQLAIDGILGAIASASITSHLRRTGVSPFADSTGLQRCYSIWVRGILPLLLNLLDAVQASIVSEVVIFISQFRTLLSASEIAFSAPESSRLSSPNNNQNFMTLSTCSELHSLALIFYILNGFKESVGGNDTITEVKWDAAGVLENVEFWLGSRALLRERLLPLGDRETEMSRKKNGCGETLLEAKIVEELKGIKAVLNGGGD